MDKSIHLSIGVYDQVEAGKTILDTLQDMHRSSTITLVDLAMLTKSSDGKLEVQETRELTAGKGGRRGAIILGVVGLIYPPSLIATVIAGGGIGALAGRIRDTGIKKDQMREVADKIEPGKVAVVVLADEEWQGLVEDTLKGYEGHLVSQDLGSETSADVAALADAPAED